MAQRVGNRPLKAGDVFDWLAAGVQVKVWVAASKVVPEGNVPGVTVTVSPLGALVCTV